MKITCKKCGNEIEFSLKDCAKEMGKEGIKTILKTENTIKKYWQSQGGKGRASKYSKEQLTEWAKKGGRPKKIVENFNQ